MRMALILSLLSNFPVAGRQAPCFMNNLGMKQSIIFLVVINLAVNTAEHRSEPITVSIVYLQQWRQDNFLFHHHYFLIKSPSRDFLSQ